MSNYTIKQLELVSGIKAHTIRMWERRYNLFTPQRTNTNIRRYTAEDLQLILNISQLLRNGYKISKLASKSLDEIVQLTLSNTNKTSISSEMELEPLFISLFSFNQDNLKSSIKKKIEEHGLEATYESIIIPLFYRIGVLWQTGMLKTTHEHFITSIIKNILISNYENLSEPSSNSPLAIFFLPENEFHELGLLYFAYIAKKKGLKTLYFGQSTPVEDVITSSLELKPSILFTSTSSSISKLSLNELTKTIRKNFKSCHLCITGYKANQDRYKLPKDVTLISSADSFNRVIKSAFKK